MNVNLTPAEYEMVCRVADHYGSKPAPLAHEWIVRAAAHAYGLIVLTEQARDRELGKGGEPSAASPPSGGAAPTGGTTT